MHFHGIPQQVLEQITESAPKQFKILVVDDEEMTRDTLCAMLENPNYILQTAASGSEALMRATSFVPDLIVMDIDLCDTMSGIDVCKSLKRLSITDDASVIFVTGRADLLSSAFAAGGVDYIHKPVNLPELLARVNNQLKIRQLQLTLRSLCDYYESRLHQVAAALN